MVSLRDNEKKSRHHTDRTHRDNSKITIYNVNNNKEVLHVFFQGILKVREVVGDRAAEPNVDTNRIDAHDGSHDDLISLEAQHRSSRAEKSDFFFKPQQRQTPPKVKCPPPPPCCGLLGILFVFDVWVGDRKPVGI